MNHIVLVIILLIILCFCIITFGLCIMFYKQTKKLEKQIVDKDDMILYKTSTINMLKEQNNELRRKLYGSEIEESICGVYCVACKR